MFGHRKGDKDVSRPWPRVQGLTARLGQTASEASGDLEEGREPPAPSCWRGANSKVGGFRYRYSSKPEKTHQFPLKYAQAVSPRALHPRTSGTLQSTPEPIWAQTPLHSAAKTRHPTKKVKPQERHRALTSPEEAEGHGYLTPTTQIHRRNPEGVPWGASERWSLEETASSSGMEYGVAPAWFGSALSTLVPAPCWVGTGFPGKPSPVPNPNQGACHLKGRHQPRHCARGLCRLCCLRCLRWPRATAGD